MRAEMKVIDCIQGSPEWFAARAGRVTASRVADIMRKGKSGPSKMRETYKGELVAERLSGVQEDGFKSAPMMRGTEVEPKARDTYAFMFGAKIQQVGLVIHPTIEMAAASTDSLVGDDGLLEVKCPNSSTHIQTLLGEPIDPDYVKQIQWGLACTGRQWCDYISFDDRLPPEMQLHRIRVLRDHATILEMEIAVRAFLKEVDELVEELTTRYRSAAA
jgi:putative phage-type endonuclease